jgi:lactoylglutathione lyase
MEIKETRVAITADDYETAVAFWRDAFGLRVIESWSNEGGSGIILDGGHATIEILSADQTRLVDAVEGGKSGPVRLALEVDDSEAAAEQLARGGATLVHEPVTTPWSHRNVRLAPPDGPQLTLFTVL